MRAGSALKIVHFTVPSSPGWERAMIEAMRLHWAATFSGLPPDGTARSSGILLESELTASAQSHTLDSLVRFHPTRITDEAASQPDSVNDSNKSSDLDSLVLRHVYKYVFSLRLSNPRETPWLSSPITLITTFNIAKLTET